MKKAFEQILEDDYDMIVDAKGKLCLVEKTFKAGSIKDKYHKNTKKMRK